MLLSWKPPPAVLLLAAAFGVAASIEKSNPVVELNKVTFRGIAANNVEHFLNIRYAYDTSGQRRFAPPEPYLYPEGQEVNATAPGPACPQDKAALPPFFDETPEISEDCLNLRISRPAGTKAGDKLPVVVHLHGGGVIKGSAYDSHFDPDNLLSLSTSLGKPVIYVALNYRITIFGFARLPVLKEQNAMNIGMRDQRAAFEWVKDNIAAFGGDPERVTSFGLSAGGTFTSLHLTSYGGKKGVPFTQGWAMSGPTGTSVNMTSDATEHHTRAVAENVGCDIGKSDEDILACLREVPMEELTKKAMKYSIKNMPPQGTFTFIPAVDGDFIPDRPSVLYRSGNFVKNIPMVFGWAQDDGATNAGAAENYQTEESMKAAVKSIAQRLTDEDYKRMFALYAAEDFEEDLRNYEARKSASDPVVPIHWFRISRILRDILFTCSSIDLGREMSRQSTSPDFTGVYLYSMNQSMITPMFKDMGMPYINVCHGSDTNYIFNGVFPEGQISDSDKRLSYNMATSFIHFAHDGNPSTGTDTDDQGFRYWPQAFAGARHASADGEQIPLQGDGQERHPASTSSFKMQVIGGPLGTGHASTAKGGGSCRGAKKRRQITSIAGGLDYDRERRRLIRREKLVERCDFINSLAEKLDV